MVSAKARQAYVTALSKKFNYGTPLPSAVDMQREYLRSKPAVPQTRRGLSGAGANALAPLGVSESGNAFDNAMARIGESATADSNPIGKILGPILESNVTQNILKGLSTPFAALQPLVEFAAQEAPGALPKLLGADENSGVEGGDIKASELPGRMGDNLYDLWNNDSTRKQRTGANVVDRLFNLSEEDVQNLGTGESWARGLGGLGIDIATDPLSYVTGAGALKLGRVSGRTADEALTSGTKLRDAFKVSDSESLIRQNIRNSESWRRSRNSTASRTAGMKKVADQLDVEKPTELPTPRETPPLKPSVTPAAERAIPDEAIEGILENSTRETSEILSEAFEHLQIGGMPNRNPMRIASGVTEPPRAPVLPQITNGISRTIPERLIPYINEAGEAVDGPVAASGAGRAQSGLDGVEGAPVATSQALAPLTGPAAGAWRSYLGRQVKAGTISSLEANVLKAARNANLNPGAVSELQMILQARKITERSIRDLAEIVENAPLADVFRQVSRLDELVNDVPDGPVRQGAQETLEEVLPDIIDPEAFDLMEATEKIGRELSPHATARKFTNRPAEPNFVMGGAHRSAPVALRDAPITPARMEAAKKAASEKHNIAAEANPDAVLPVAKAKTAGKAKPEMEFIEYDDLAKSIEAGVSAGYMSKLYGGLKRGFAFFSDTGDVGRAANQSFNGIRNSMSGYRTTLNNLATKYGQPVGKGTKETMFDAAFQALVKGETDFSRLPGLEQAVKELSPLLNTFMDVRHTPGKSTFGSVAMGNMSIREAGFAFKRMNDIFAAKGLSGGKAGGFFGPDYIRTGTRKVRGEDGKMKTSHDKRTLTFDERADYWRSPEFKLDERLADFAKKNPQFTGLGAADFMGRMMDAHIQVMKESSIAMEAVRLAQKTGLGSTKPQNGWVRFTNDVGSVAPYMPRDMYFHPDIAKQIKGMEDFLTEAAKPGSKKRQWLQQHVFPWVDIWKSGMTIWRPGHHVRNLVGDLSMSYMAGYGGSFGQAFKLMKYGANWSMKEAGKWSSPDALDALARRAGLTTESLSETVGGDAVINTVTLKGGAQETLRAREMYAAAQERFVLPTTAVRENLADNIIHGATTDLDKVNKIRDRMAIFGGKAREKAVGISEGRDHTARLAHFADFVKKEAKNYRTLDDLYDAAAQNVRQWHPDGSGMTNFEQRTMSHLMPFYSWTRKAIPLTLESIFTKPGRFMVFPKAMYAVAQANGVEAHSIADPFPDDQYFPSFMTDKMFGPQWGQAGGYGGVNPGFFSADVLNTFSGSSLKNAAGEGGINGLRSVGPTEGLIGMLNPVLKTPFELAAGARLDTGAPITSTSDYLNGIIPQVNSVASVTGFSPVGTVGSFGSSLLGGAVGQPTQFDTRTTSVAKGNTEAFEQRAILNYLLGAQQTNMSQANYIKRAEIEARNREGQMQRF